MKVGQFAKLCKKYKLELGDLPAFPPRNMTDQQWIDLIRLISEAKYGKDITATTQNTK